MKPTRVIYYSQFQDNQCSVTFGPYIGASYRSYYPITEASKERLSRLIEKRAASVRVHLVLYVSIWAVFSSDSMKGI
jgi:hypothetical protein